MPETETTQQEETNLLPPEPEPEVAAIQHKPVGRPPGKVKESTQRGVDEDFFDYLARIEPKDWSSVNTSGLYIYKLQSGGNLRIGPVLRKAISFDELKDLAIKHGPGNYKCQFQTRLPHLTRCGEVVPFDADSLPTTSGTRAGSSGSSDMKGFDKAIEASSNMLEHSAKTAIDLHKEVQVQSHKQPDIAGLISAIGTLIPRPEPRDDKTTELLLVMLQNQAKDAERRAEAAERRAEEQRRADREEADRREQRAKADAEAQRERDKNFFELMLKQSETKADSLNQMTGLLTSFMKAKEMIDDSIGGGPKGPWDLVAGVADTVLQQGPAIVAAMKGAPPAEVQRIQQQANPAEAGPQPSTPQMQFQELVRRIATYCQRDSEKWNVDYVGEMIQEEYGGIAVELFENTSGDKIVEYIRLTPPGDIVLAHPDGPAFIDGLIKYFKTEELPQEDEPEEIILANPEAVRPRRRANGVSRDREAKSA